MQLYAVFRKNKNFDTIAPCFENGNKEGVQHDRKLSNSLSLRPSGHKTPLFTSRASGQPLSIFNTLYVKAGKIMGKRGRVRNNIQRIGNI